MGSRGPVRQPRSLKIVKDPAAEIEPETLADEIEPAAPEQPPGMPEAGRDIWNALVPELDALGLISRVDGYTLDLAIRHYLAAASASDELAEADGAAVYDEKNERMQKHPADAVFRLHSAQFLAYADKLGMTFVSRARLAARGSDDGEDNPFLPSTGSSGG